MKAICYNNNGSSYQDPVTGRDIKKATKARTKREVTFFENLDWNQVLKGYPCPLEKTDHVFVIKDMTAVVPWKGGSDVERL